MKTINDLIIQECIDWHSQRAKQLTEYIAGRFSADNEEDVETRHSRDFHERCAKAVTGLRDTVDALRPPSADPTTLQDCVELTEVGVAA